MSMDITKEQITDVKSRGFLQNRGTGCFSGRVVSAGGLFTSDDLRQVAECAERFGNGNVVFTSRQSAEIAGIPYDMIPEAERFVEDHGLMFGGTGAKIRPVTACKGDTCVFGNIDTRALSRTIHERFYLGMRDVRLPHKFKIGVGGCPNSCMKPSLNDVGIEGCRIVSLDRGSCRGCSRCIVSEACPVGAVSVADGGPSIDKDRCIGCGICVGKCPFKALVRDSESACRVYVGGTWGKKKRIGTPLPGTVSESEVPDMIEKIILWYKENAYAKERLASTIDRLGMEALISTIVTDDILGRKAEILSSDIKEQ